MQISFSQEPPEEEEEITYSYSAENCPINTDSLIDSPFLSTDFTEFTQDDYGIYMGSFYSTAYSSIVGEMVTYYQESYSDSLSGPLNNDIMKEIISSQKTSYIAGNSIRYQMLIGEQINDCINRKLQIAVIVEQALINATSQAFVSNSILGMMASMQDDMNAYRDMIEDQVTSDLEQAEAFPFKP